MILRCEFCNKLSIEIKEPNDRLICKNEKCNHYKLKEIEK